MIKPCAARRVLATAGVAAAFFGASSCLKTEAVTSEPYTWKNVQMIGGGFVDGIVADPAQKGLMYARTDVGGAYRWDSFKNVWIPITNFISGHDNNLIGIESIGIDPSNANRVYLAAGTYTQSWAGNGAIFRSLDQGATWKRTDLPFKVGSNEDGRFAGERLAVDPNYPAVVYFGSRKDGLWRSLDFGATWNNVTSFPSVGDTNGIGITWVTFDPSSSTEGTQTPVIYCGVSTKQASVYRSTDAGATWQAIASEPVGLRPNHGVMSSDGTLYITYGSTPGPNDMDNGAVWKLDTKGDVWTDVTPTGPSAKLGFGFGGLAVDAQNPMTVMVTTLDRWSVGDDCFRSTDGGAHWTGLKDAAVLNWSLSPWVTFGGAKPKFGWWMGALAIDPFDSDHVLFGTGATIWACDDATKADAGNPTHWSVGAKGIEELVVNAVISPPAGAPELCAVWDVDGMRNEDLTISPPNGFFQPPFGRDVDIAFAYGRPSIIARVASSNGAGKGAYSTDDGLTWNAFASVPAGKGDGTIAASADGSTFVWSEDGGGSFRSRDDGSSWTPCAALPSKASVIADTADSTRFYAMDPADGTAWVSSDGGATFDRTGAQSSHPKMHLKATPGVVGDLWLGADDGLYHSLNSGRTFTQITGVAQASQLGFGAAAPGQTYPTIFIVGKVGGTYGFYRSDDTGTTWVRVNDDDHQFGWISAITGDPRVYGRVYVGTDGRGVFYGDIAGTHNSPKE